MRRPNEKLRRLWFFDQKTSNEPTINATVSEIIEYICPYLPGIQIKYVDSPIMNQLSYAVSSEKLKALGFESIGSLPEAILATIQLLRPNHL